VESRAARGDAAPEDGKVVTLKVAVIGGGPGGTNIRLQKEKRNMNDPVIFKVGAASEKITPPVGTALAGYYHERRGETVRDDLFARAMLIRHGEEQILLVTCDLISISAAIVGEARDLILQRIGVPPERVMISATHTHTGPVLDGKMVDRDYVSGLPGRIAKAAVAASAHMRDATLRLGAIDIPGYNRNRIHRMSDGTEIKNRPQESAAHIVGPCIPCDTQMIVLAACDLDHRPIAMLVNFAAHADVIGGGHATFLSADWPGVMASAVRAVYGDDVEALFLQGCAGDLNQSMIEGLPRNREAGALRIGRGLAGAAIACAERSRPMTRGGLKAMLHVERIPYYTRDAAFFDKIARLKAQPERTELEDAQVKLSEQWQFDGQTADVPIQALRVGDLSLVGLPAEVFNAIGIEIKHWSPTEFTAVVELANARASQYVPTTDQAARDAYGATPILSRWLCADAGRRMADRAQAMLHSLG